ncbi:sulfurtransferase complex subunit TusD [Enterobacteriaceae endosymbiont of Donacia sparganii]|uniref:sulfurtransferase complex subunit TusD n=1 Tax=Enterobacteriaceae endosymbiont of Donacia sparganii TaxID=2675785 RepID=UPI0014495D8A|nr:sulfurtransferase complex subunit TusD [Enterobacteriaceae endosymbiont of Donacia sparganii]QJC35803.1 sulfurtransferase complex subunit TusD [Enterobacteriaceae endosymbiont of Donacia sparganii]
MIFVILITEAPYNTQNSYSAYLFTKAVIQKKKIVKNIFFYRDGVCNANKNIKFNKDEFNLLNSWKELSIKYHINLYICITSAKKRGLILKDSSYKNNSLDLNQNNYIIDNKFKITTLSTFTKSILTCDYLVQF